MESIDWLRGVPVSQDSMLPARIAQSDLDRAAMRRLHVRRRQQGEKIKSLLCQSPAAKIVSGLLHEMQQVLGVRLNEHSLEDPGLRLVWKVTFGYRTPWTCCHFIVRRLFAVRELDPADSHYLGPAWEAPEALLNYTDDELARLLAQEEIEVRSAAGVRRVWVGNAGWVAQLKDVLREAYQHPFRRRDDL